MQILVLGSHRSGTSVVTRIINMMGAYFGPEKMAYGFDEANPKGYWERKDVMQSNNQLLLLGKSAWCDLSRWPLDAPPEPDAELRKQMQTTLMGMDAFRPWVMKDPRLCLTLPCWLPLLEVPVAVLVARDPVETALSLQRRDNFPLPLGLAIWEYHAVGALNASRTLPRAFARHEQFITDPAQATEALFHDLESLGVQALRLPSKREVEAFITPSLHRARNHSSHPELSLSQHQRMLASTMAGEIEAHEPFTVSEASQKIMAQFAYPAP